MNDFEKARDEKLEQIRIGKQDESTAIRMANWTHDWSRAYTLKHDPVVLGLLDAIKDVIRNSPDVLAKKRCSGPLANYEKVLAKYSRPKELNGTHKNGVPVFIDECSEVPEDLFKKPKETE